MTVVFTSFMMSAGWKEDTHDEGGGGEGGRTRDAEAGGPLKPRKGERKQKEAGGGRGHVAGRPGARKTEAESEESEESGRKRKATIQAGRRQGHSLS